MPKRIMPLLILLLAAALRLFNIGVWTTWGDELNIINAAIGIVAHGDWVWVGNESSFGGLAAHSPFTTYITAIFGLIAPHPLVMRLGYALWGIVTVALMYAVVRKHIGYPAALIAMLLVAVMPMPLYWSRFVWNPNLAPLFIILWIHTAVEGYQHRKQWAQWLHWLSLTFAVQSQTALVMLLPISLLLTGFSLWRGNQRSLFLRQHIPIAVMCLITCVPWVYGLYGITQGWWQPALGVGNFDSGALSLRIPTLERLTNEFALITGSVDYWRGNLNSISNAPTWWFPNWGQTLLTMHSIFVLAAVIFLGLQRKQRLFGWFLLATLLLPFSILFINRQLSDFYMMSSVYAAIIALAWFGQWLIHKVRWTALLFVAIISFQGWLSLSMIDWHAQQSALWTYGEVVNLVDRWHNNQYDVLVWEYDPTSSEIEQHKWRTHWQILSARYPIRYITAPEALPIAENQRFILSNPNQPWHQDLRFDTVHINPERTFSVMTLSPDIFDDVSHTPVDASLFGDVAQIIGLAQTDNGISLFWHPLATPKTQYQFSLRIVDADNTVITQQDQRSLDTALWHIDDTVVSFLPMSTIPAEGQSYQLVMYRFEDGVPLPIVADNGDAIGNLLLFETVQN